MMSKAEKLLRARLPELVADLRDKATSHGATLTREPFTISNADSDDTAVIRVYDEIGWYAVNAADFAEQLDQVTAPNMRVEINSPGGDVFDGIAIYQALRNHPAHVTTRVDGIAASIASIIAQAGDTRIVQASSQMMIHNAWGLVVGDTHDHSEMAQLLDQQDTVLAGIYATHSGRDASVFRDLMDSETWLTADQIVEHGLADEVVEPPNKTSAKTDVTLNDEIAYAVDAVRAVVDSAERVAALRAEAGKTLSNRNLESLAGLKERIVALCDTTPPEPSNPWTADAVAALQARLAVRTREELIA